MTPEEMKAEIQRQMGPRRVALARALESVSPWPGVQYTIYGVDGFEEQLRERGYEVRPIESYNAAHQPRKTA